MEKTTAKWIVFGKFTPSGLRPFKVLTSWGEIREAAFNVRHGSYLFTDCTHPMQNCHCYMAPETKWHYLYEKDLFDYPPEPNRYQMQKDGEAILEQITKTGQPRSWFKGLFSYLRIDWRVRK